MLTRSDHFASLVIWSGGVLMYTWYALLDQRPRVWIRWSGTPACAAAVAASMRKLWLEKLPRTPVEPKIRLRHVDSSSRVRGWPFSRINKGPSPHPRRWRNASTAFTTQIGLRPRPMKIKQPFRNGSVFEAFMLTRSEVGWENVSAAISATVKCTAGEKADSDGTVNSDDLRKPKKAKQQAAQNIKWSCWRRSRELRMIFKCMQWWEGE